MGLASPAKVLLLIPHLGGGGAEHITATLARCLSAEKYEIHLGLVTQTSREAAQARELFLPSIHVHALGALRVRRSAWRILKLVWRIKPALILSGMAHLNLLLLLLRPLLPRRTQVLIRQNGSLSAAVEATHHPRLAGRLFRMAFRRPDRIICQTRSMADELVKELGVDGTRLIVLRNPVDIFAIRASAHANELVGHLPSLRLLTVARLAPEKGIDLLLDAVAGIRKRFPSVELHVAGTGRCNFALQSQCRRLGIEQNVCFLGQVDFPAHLFRDSSVFVLPSRHEGMPNALLEAAAAGLPIVATPASTGLSELLRDQPGVWLADDVSSSSLAAALSDALMRLQPGQRFKHAWIEPFGLNVAIQAYETEIDRSLLESRT